MKTPNGQIVQVPTAINSGPTVTAIPGTSVMMPPTMAGGGSTVNIPGYGTVQIITTPQPPPGNAQILSPGGTLVQAAPAQPQPTAPTIVQQTPQQQQAPIQVEQS